MLRVLNWVDVRQALKCISRLTRFLSQFRLCTVVLYDNCELQNMGGCIKGWQLSILWSYPNIWLNIIRRSINKQWIGMYVEARGYGMFWNTIRHLPTKTKVMTTTDINRNIQSPGRDCSPASSTYEPRVTPT